MKEDFLHFIWKTLRFDMSNLMTTLKEPIAIIKPGIQNMASGPDFSEAIVKIGETTWAGQVEIHINSSDWYIHNHHKDKAYQNVVLHVVFKDDKEILNDTGESLPCLVLDGLITKPLLTKYQFIDNNRSWVPCQTLLNTVPDIIKTNWVERLAIVRVHRKSEEVLLLADQLKYNWHELFYRMVARSFGFKINNHCMELLAERTPLNILSKHKNNLFQIEALLFGQAGFLNEIFSEDHPNQLKKEYLHLKQKYNLIGLDKHQWKLGGMRPSSFPTIRIAQLAKLIHVSSHLFSKILERMDVKDIKELFKIQASEYWDTHYRFDVLSKKKAKIMGDSALNGFLINTVSPILFAYGTYKGNFENNERAIKFLSFIKSESNSLLSKWVELGFKNKNALSSQGLIELKNEFCAPKKCLQCGIGNMVLK